MHRGDGINIQLKTFFLGFYPLDVEREIFWSRIPKKKERFIIKRRMTIWFSNFIYLFLKYDLNFSNL